MDFQQYDTIYYSILNNQSNTTTKLACFDMDDTLIKVASNNRYSLDENDWEFLYNNTIDKLNELNKDYKIVIFTNQRGISSGKVNPTILINKINNIRKKFNFNIDVLLATNDDYYRKPMTGMFDFYIKQTGIKVDKNNSFFCGDAGGRQYNTKNKDFSIFDRYFAHNIELKYYTPEELFNQPIKKYTINDLYNSINFQINNTFDINQFITKNNKQELILLVGRPASGKTTFAKKYYKDYNYINQDELKTSDKCIKKANEFIKNGKNVIIDNTNGSLKTRQKYYDIISNLKREINVKVFIFDIDVKLSYHLNNYRVQQSFGKYKLIPTIVYNLYKKNYVEPTIEEYKNIEIIKLPLILDNDSIDNIKKFKFDI